MSEISLEDIEKGKYNLLKKFLDKSKNPDYIIPDVGVSMLEAACWSGQYKLVKLLLERGADVNKNAPLIDAVIGLNVDIVKLLLSYGADPNVTSEEKESCSEVSPLTVYPFNNDGEDNSKALDSIVKLLVENGADINLLVDGMTAYDVAMDYDEDEYAEILLKYGAVPNIN